MPVITPHASIVLPLPFLTTYTGTAVLLRVTTRLHPFALLFAFEQAVAPVRVGIGVGVERETGEARGLPLPQLAKVTGWESLLVPDKQEGRRLSSVLRGSGSAGDTTVACVQVCVHGDVAVVGRGLWVYLMRNSLCLKLFESARCCRGTRRSLAFHQYCGLAFEDRRLCVSVLFARCTIVARCQRVSVAPSPSKCFTGSRDAPLPLPCIHTQLSCELVNLGRSSNSHAAGMSAKQWIVRTPSNTSIFHQTPSGVYKQSNVSSVLEMKRPIRFFGRHGIYTCGRRFKSRAVLYRPRNVQHSVTGDAR